MPINAPIDWLLAIDPPAYQYRVPAWWELGASDKNGNALPFEGFQNEDQVLKRVERAKDIGRYRIAIHRRKKSYSVRN